jgi:hypothetical protein
MIDAFFRIAYTGSAGSGFGMLVFRAGAIAGADVAGSTYDGTYREDPETGKISVEVTMAAPAGITPVQTGIPLASPMRIPISITLTQADLTSEEPTLLVTPLGPVNVIFSKIRDFP